MAPWIKSDLIRLLLVLLVSLFAGLILGRLFLCIFIGSLVVIIWYYRALLGFFDFIKYGADDKLADIPGIMNELVREFELIRKHYLFREEKLSGALNRFEESAAALPDAVVVTGMDGKIEWVNKKAGEYLGIEWPQDSGQRLFNLIRDPDLGVLLDEENGQFRSSPIEFVSPVHPEQRLELRFNSYGNDSMLFVIRDITELHRLNRIRKDFIANASHELRTPLTVITGYLEAFDEDEELCPESWRPQIARMREQAGRMQRLIEDLLTLSTLESAEESAPEEEVRVTDMLNSVIGEARTLSAEQNHVFRTELDASILLLGSHRDLYSAFSNLVFNAVQYTPANGTITIHWSRDGNGMARMRVSDTGEGIEEQYIPRITERFYRVDKGRSRAKGGTGLGLAIVKHVLLRHGAGLEVHSVPGSGSDFVCIFPSSRVLVRTQTSPGVSKTA